MTNEFTLKAAIRGLATEFTPGEQPLEYAQRLTNRFINLDGDAEQRPGLTNSTTLVSACAAWTGKWLLIHEHQKTDGGTIDFATQFVTQDATGEPISSNNNNYLRIAKKDSAVGEWEIVEVHNSEPDSAGFYSLTLGFDRQNKFPVDPNHELPSAVQFSRSSIFSNDNITSYFYDEILDRLYQLNSRINAGTAGSGSSDVRLTDANVDNWANETLVAPNDIVYNTTRNAWAVVTSVGSTGLDHTAITSAGGGGAGLGDSGANLNGDGNPQAQGDNYEIWDMIENNFFPVDPNSSRFDNVAVAASGTDTTTIEVSSNLLNRNDTMLRPGDYVYNTTKSSLQRIASIEDRGGNDGLKLNMTTSAFSGAVSGQASGDTMLFLKSAVPIASQNHVHYGRLYLVDSREKTRIFPSGPDDFRDFTTFQDELNVSTIDYGSRQPDGDEILALDTFQRYLIAAGRRNVYVSEGVNPVQDTSISSTDLQPVGLFTQGVVSKRPLANIGSEMLFAAPDGLRQFNITDILAVTTDNISEVIKTELRDALADESTLERDVQVAHYPRRNWVMFKVGDVIYNFNYTPIYLQGQIVPGGSWSKFTGGFAEVDNIILRSNGDVAASWFDQDTASTYFFDFDKGNNDDGVLTFSTSVPRAISTQYRSAWVGPGEGRLIQNRYIRPFLVCDLDTSFTFSIQGDLETERVDDTITVSALGNTSTIDQWTVNVDAIGGQSRVNRNKYPLRTYGDYFAVDVDTSAAGRNIISKMIFYGNPYDTR